MTFIFSVVHGNRNTILHKYGLEIHQVLDAVCYGHLYLYCVLNTLYVIMQEPIVMKKTGHTPPANGIALL